MVHLVTIWHRYINNVALPFHDCRCRMDGTVTGAALGKGAARIVGTVIISYVTRSVIAVMYLIWLSAPAQPSRNNNCPARPPWRGFSCTMWL